MSEGIRTPDNQIHSLELYQLSYTHHTFCSRATDLFGAPGRIRTSDPRLRRPLLYPLSYRRVGVTPRSPAPGSTSVSDLSSRNGVSAESLVEPA